MFLLLNGCSSVSYYSQLASGQLQLLRAREPVAKVIADPSRDATLRTHLTQSQKARDFASEQLHLPDNQSYRLYADIGRPYVVWNVFATPEFSLTPQNHCFPIAGCVLSRYYSQSARAAKRRSSACKAWTWRLAASRLIRPSAGSMTRSSIR